MSLIICKECGEQVSSKATDCPQCGYPLKKKGNKFFSGCGCLLVIILGCFLLFLILSYQGDKVSSYNYDSSSTNKYNNSKPQNSKLINNHSVNKTLTLNKEQTDLLNDLQQQGLISIDAKNITVEVEPVFWSKMKFSLKKDFSATCAVFIAHKRNKDLYWCYIVDMYSGKKLAKYSQSWGFTLY